MTRSESDPLAIGFATRRLSCGRAYLSYDEGQDRRTPRPAARARRGAADHSCPCPRDLRRQDVRSDVEARKEAARVTGLHAQVGREEQDVFRRRPLMEHRAARARSPNTQPPDDAARLSRRPRLAVRGQARTAVRALGRPVGGGGKRRERTPASGASSPTSSRRSLLRTIDDDRVRAARQAHDRFYVHEYGGGEKKKKRGRTRYARGVRA